MTGVPSVEFKANDQRKGTDIYVNDNILGFVETQNFFELERIRIRFENAMHFAYEAGYNDGKQAAEVEESAPDGWTPNPGYCPVNGETVVEYVLEDGYTDCMSADELRWEGTKGQPYHIKYYRVVEEKAE